MGAMERLRSFKWLPYIFAVLVVLALISITYTLTNHSGASDPVTPPKELLTLTGSEEQTSSSFLVSFNKWQIAVSLSGNTTGPVPFTLEVLSDNEVVKTITQKDLANGTSGTIDMTGAGYYILHLKPGEAPAAETTSTGAPAAHPIPVSPGATPASPTLTATPTAAPAESAATKLSAPITVTVTQG